jgi:hypothetical protein
MRIGALLATGLLSVTNLPAQQPSASQPAQVSAPADSVPDSPAAKPKNKGGLFGKAKKLASSKVVRTVAKAAACTMVPGGQAIAGAIDAASSKSAGEAVQGAAGAASGSSCMPGMGAGMASAGMPGGMPSAGMTAAGITPALVSAAAGGMPTTMPMSAQMQMAGAAGYAGMDADAMGIMPNEEAMAECLGISVEEYRAFSNPTQGQSRPMTKDEMKRQAKIGKKVQGRQQACAMQQAAQAMVMSRQSAAIAQQRMAAANAQVTTEAPGYAPVLGPDPLAELKKGKTIIRDIDWIAGGVKVSDAETPAFEAAMTQIGKAMAQAGGSYQIDIYLDQRYGEAELKMLGPSRIAAVQEALQRTSGGSVTVKPGKAKKDKNPRLEIVRAAGR